LFIFEPKSMKLITTFVCASLLATFNLQAQTLELKRVSLSSSGVGYFEYEAQVNGKTTLSLPVALDKVDDVLKSLVIYDSVGSIGGVSLPGLDPIAQTLKQLPFDAEALNKPAALLEALRGADISIGGKQPMRGRIVSVLPIAATDKDPAKHQVMLMSPQGMQQFVLETAENLQFEDLALREQINKALTALSNNRAKDARNIEIISEGTGARTVRIGYVTTVPIWKTAYRFTLPSASQKTDAMANIQGWAVIENMSGQDWSNVQLTLTAGKPVAFSQELYRSYYNYRPQVAVELPSNIVPTADAGTYRDSSPAQENLPRQRSAALASARPPAPASAAAPMMASAKMAATGAAYFADAAPSPALAMAADSATVQDDSTQASYTFALPVTVSSGRSLSIPIIQHALPLTRLALYQPNVNVQFPLAAIELSNTSPSTMPAGAVTLYESSSSGNQFVGDAQLTTLPAKDKRYVAYALDQKLSIAQRNAQNNTLKRYSVKGTNLLTERVYLQDATFTVKSTHDEPRDVVVEVPLYGAPWKLEPSSDYSIVGTSANQYRLNIASQPLTSRTVLVRQSQTNEGLQALSNFDLPTLRIIIQDSKLDPGSKPVINAMIALMDKRDEATKRRMALDEQLRLGRENQNRIRDNLKAVPVKSEPHNRYMDELNKADATDAKLQSEQASGIAAQQAAEAALRDYLISLK
jgi:hypothetical protein